MKEVYTNFKMNPESSEYITTRIKTMKDGSLSIIFNSERFMDMNQAYTAEMGRSLLETADTDPLEVYRYIRRAIGQRAAQYATNFAYDGVVVSTTTNGVDATRSLAEETMLAIMPPEYEGPRTVRVGIEPIVEGDDPALPIEPIQLLELKVTPTDLAA